MSGQRQLKDVNVLRFMLIKERCGLYAGSINLNKYIYIYVDRPESLPPCRRALVRHILRANFQNGHLELQHQLLICQNLLVDMDGRNIKATMVHIPEILPASMAERSEA